MAKTDLITNNATEIVGSLLSEPGDKMTLHTRNIDLEARVTPSGRQVVKMTDGVNKRSAVRYSTGKVVITDVPGTDK